MSWTWQALGGGAAGGGGGAPPYVQPALQPNSYGAAGMWALQYDPGGLIAGTDRSGNVRNLSDGFPYDVPDIIKNKQVGQLSNVPGSRYTGVIASNATSAALKMAAFTITCRICAPRYMSGGGASTICAAAFPATNVEWAFTFDNGNGAGTGVLHSFWQHGGFVGVGFDSTLFVRDGTWHFVSYRRTAGYVVTLGLDGVYQTSAALTPPDTTGANPTFSIGTQAGSVNI